MQKPQLGLDEEDDTAFGGLAPRSGPGTDKTAEPPRTSTVKWLAVAGAAILILLVLLSITGRL